jgi:thioredoxin-related protein
MDKEVLADKEVAATLNKDFVYIRIDVDKDPGMADNYGVRGFPTVWFLEPAGKKIASIPGFIPKTEFKKSLVYVKSQHYKFMSLRDFLFGKKG